MPTILAPLDFSSATAQVVAEATELARALQARLILLHITPPPFIAADDIGAAELIVDLTEIAKKSATRDLARWKKKLQEDGLTVETLHSVGAPVAQIVQAASDESADYIVLGSHGHGALYDLLVGSTATGVLKKARCPVMLVAPSQKARRT